MSTRRFNPLVIAIALFVSAIVLASVAFALGRSSTPTQSARSVPKGDDFSLSILPPSPSVVANAPKTPTSAANVLELTTGDCIPLPPTYFRCEGFVKNISESAQDGLSFHVLLFTTDGTRISSDQGLVDYKSLLPGQTSPFKAYAKYNPAAARWDFEFQAGLGGPVVKTLDSRPAESRTPLAQPGLSAPLVPNPNSKQVGNALITIHGAMLFTPSPTVRGTHAVVVDITLKNTGRSTYDMTPYIFKLQDSAGFSNDPMAGGPEPSFSIESLAPGQSMRAYVLFKVLDGRKASQLQIKSYDGAAGFINLIGP